MSVRVPALALVAVLLAACGDGQQTLSGSEPSSTPPTSSPSPLPASVPLETACPKLEMAHLPAQQGPVTDAFVCGTEDRPVPGDGVWLFQVVRRVTVGLDPLLTVYDRADAPPSGPHVGCTADLPDPLVIYLHSDHGVDAVRAPWTMCRKPTPEAKAAYEALTTTIVWEKKDQRIQTQLSIDSRCSDRYKDMLWFDEREGRSANRADLPIALTGSVTMCTYRTERDVDGDSIGHLDGGRILTAQQREAFNDALAGVRVDETCSRHDHTRFALLHASGGLWALVALDGCAVSQDGGWWRAGDDLRSALH